MRGDEAGEVRVQEGKWGGDGTRRRVTSAYVLGVTGQGCLHARAEREAEECRRRVEAVARGDERGARLQRRRHALRRRLGHRVVALLQVGLDEVGLAPGQGEGEGEGEGEG